MAERRLSLADQVLVNALIFLANQRLEHVGNTDLALDVIREVLPACSTDIPQMEAPIRAAVELMALGPRRAKMRGAWGFARSAAGDACAQFAFWRAGLALDALRSATTTTGKTDAAA